MRALCAQLSFRIADDAGQFWPAHCMASCRGCHDAICRPALGGIIQQKFRLASPCCSKSFSWRPGVGQRLGQGPFVTKKRVPENARGTKTALTRQVCAYWRRSLAKFARTGDAHSPRLRVLATLIRRACADLKASCIQLLCTPPFLCMAILTLRLRGISFAILPSFAKLPPSVNAQHEMPNNVRSNGLD